MNQTNHQLAGAVQLIKLLVARLSLESRDVAAFSRHSIIIFLLCYSSIIPSIIMMILW
jgi:hypothetical protein